MKPQKQETTPGSIRIEPPPVDIISILVKSVNNINSQLQNINEGLNQVGEKFLKRDQRICQQFSDIRQQLENTIKIFDEPNEDKKGFTQQQAKPILNAVLMNNPNLIQYSNNKNNEENQNDFKQA